MLSVFITADFQIFSPFFVVDFMDNPDSVILDSGVAKMNLALKFSPGRRFFNA